MKKFKSGTYVNQGTHKSFMPTDIFRAWVLGRYGGNPSS